MKISFIFHLIMKQGVELKCASCEVVFSQQSALTNHIVEQHITENNNVCDVCGKTFSHPSSVIYHKEVICKLHDSSQIVTEIVFLFVFQRWFIAKLRICVKFATRALNTSSFCNATVWFIQMIGPLCAMFAAQPLKPGKIYTTIVIFTVKKSLTSVHFAMPNFHIKPL